MFPTLKARRDEEGYDFGDQIVHVRTRREVSRGEDGTFYQKVRTCRVGDNWFLTGEPADWPGRENVYRGVTFWVAVGEIMQLQVYASVEAVQECRRTYQRLHPKPPAEG